VAMFISIILFIVPAGKDRRERINIGTMVRTGFMLNMLGIVVVVIVTWLLGSTIFDIEPGVLPAWLSP